MGTAEKHDGFIEFGENSNVIERFSGKLLIQQEPDASSFPNGGIRNTFEARGYTAWDVSSPAFVVDTTLCIPTIFISYTGEALDYKTPLLKALGAVDKAATEVCQLFDKSCKPAAVSILIGLTKAGVKQKNVPVDCLCLQTSAFQVSALGGRMSH